MEAPIGPRSKSKSETRRIFLGPSDPPSRSDPKTDDPRMGPPDLCHGVWSGNQTEMTTGQALCRPGVTDMLEMTPT